MTPEASLLLWTWVTMLVVAVVLFPVDAELLPVWLSLRVRLFLINAYMRAFALRLWWQLPKPRPPFRYIPVQNRGRL